jgi:type IV pilus assembly protein PilQ
VDSVVLPGDEVEVRLGFDGSAPQPVAYKIDKPARIVFDLPGVRSALPGKYFNLGNGNARSVTVVESGDRSRVIVNLTELSGFNARVDGNQVYINIGKSQAVSLRTRPGGGCGFCRQDQGGPKCQLEWTSVVASRVMVRC